jgi:hypothetical protein
MKNKILIVISFLAGTFLFNSCLKDKLTEDWTSSLSGKMYAQIVNAGLQSSTISNGTADQTIRVLVNIATDALPTSDITVNLVIDAAALTAYNTAHSTSFVACPNTTVSSVTIKAGTRNGYAYITLKNANLLDLDKTYAVPVSIASVSNTNVVIASNFKTVICQVPIANQWEGTYTMKGYSLREGDSDLSGNFTGVTEKLGTSGAKSVTFSKINVWADKSVIGGIGYWKLTIDDSKTPMPVTITDDVNPAVKNMPGYNSRYDPETKTFYISAYWGTGPTNRAATDTLVYTGPY